MTKIRISEIEMLEHSVVIPVRSHIRGVGERLCAGEYVDPVTIASVDGRRCAIAGIDTLLAAAECGKTHIECNDTGAMTSAQAHLLHVRMSRKLPVNPFRVIDAMRLVSAEMPISLSEMREAELAKLSTLPLAATVRQKMSDYIQNLGERADVIPSFYHLCKMISKLKEAQQVAAFGKVLRFVDKYNEAARIYAVPEPETIEKLLTYIIKQHAEPKAKTKKRAGKIEGAETEKEAGYYHRPDRSGIDMRCECGLEYVFDAKRLSVRKRKKTDDVVILAGEHGERMYPIRGDMARYLGLNLETPVYYYAPGGDDHGDLVIISKRRIPQDILSTMNEIVCEQASPHIRG